MVNSQETKKSGPFEFLEKKVVFQISRFFFWILCAIGCVAVIISCILFLYNIIPPVKERVAEPELPLEVSISLAEIKEAIAPPKSKVERPVEVAQPSVEKVKAEEKASPKPPTPDSLQVALEAKIDTLKSYFPADKFTWTTVYGQEPAWIDYWGVVREWKTVVKKYGLDQHLNRVLQLYADKTKKIEIVTELMGIIVLIPVDDRAKALEAYARIRSRKETARNHEIDRIESETEYKRSEAEAKYLKAKAEKAVGVGKALRYLGGAFVSVALVGLFLCFLAIERNTRMLQVLIDRGIK